MPTNDFEKKVQEEMTEFKLRPSDDVWLIVEEKIRERKRRRFLFWLFPLLIGGGAALYFFGGKNKPIGQMGETVVINKGKNNNPVPKTNEPNLQINSSIKQNEDNIPGSSIQAISGRVINKEIKVKPAFNKKNSLARSVTQEWTSQNQPVTIQEEIADTSHFIAPAFGFRVAAGSPPLSIGSPRFGKMSNLPPSLMASSLHRPSRQPRWVIGLKGGDFNISDPILGGSGKKLFSGNLNSPGSGSGVGNINYITESVPKAAFSYGFTVSREFPIGRKHFFKTGLGFAQYSNLRQVGDFRDSLASPTFSNYDQSNGFYRGGSTQTFKSRYQVIEIPISLLWKIGKGNKLPLEMETGLLYGRIIQARGLVYGGYGYFDDRDFIRKNQWQINLGIGTYFFNKTKHPIGLGLNFQSGLGSFYKNQVADPKTAGFAGIKISRSL